MIERVLASLPQIGAIQQKDAERWAAGIMKYHGDRAAWHAKRLLGIGGSEIGAVIRGVKGLKDSGFSSIQKVVESKLLMRLPEFQNIHMRRGTELEHLARLAFMYRYEAAQDIAAMHAMDTGKGRPGYEWLVGNADDLVMLRGKRYVNDYKVPSSYSDVIEHDYDAQIHHYGLKARFAGVHIDGGLLTKLDLAPELALSLVDRVSTMSDADLHTLARTIALADVPGMRIVTHVVEMRREMQLDILECGSHCWNEMVITGQVPVPEKKAMVELSDVKLLDVGRYQQQYAMAQSGIKHLETMAKAATSAIFETLSGVDFADKAMPLALVNVNRKGLSKEKLVEEALRTGASEDDLASDKREYSIVALIDEIKRLNGDVESSHLFSKSLDPAKAEAYLVQHGADLESMRIPGIGLGMSTKKIHKEIGAVYQRSAGDVFSQWIDTHSITAEQDDCLEEFADDLDVIDDMSLEAASGTLQEIFAGALGRDSNVENPEPQIPMKSSAGLRQ